MSPGDRVEHMADYSHGTVEQLEQYKGTLGLVDIPGARVLWDGETESTVHPLGNLRPIP